jgi:hypothetical protein
MGVPRDGSTRNDDVLATVEGKGIGACTACMASPWQSIRQTAHDGAKHFQELAMKRALYRSSNVPLSELFLNVQNARGRRKRGSTMYYTASDERAFKV